MADLGGRCKGHVGLFWMFAIPKKMKKLHFERKLCQNYKCDRSDIFRGTRSTSYVFKTAFRL